jgi:diguanylate cyclase (GGDEF)-like protein
MPEYPTANFSESEGGLFSLSQIQHLMRVEFNRAQRYGYPIICMLISVDRISELRDLYGIDAKEEILRSIVDLLRSETRSSDFLGRMVDDRMLGVIPHTSPEGAHVLADRLVEGAQRLRFEAEGRTLQVTISIGASHNQKEGTIYFDALIQAAEGAISEAIGKGGNRFVIADPRAAED